MFEVGNLKKIISAVILVILVLASFSMLSPSKVNAQANTSEATVLSYSWYVAPANTILAEWPGDLVAVGEVQNVGSNVLGSVIVYGAAYNSSGGILDTAEAPILVNDITPGQKAPFYLDFMPETSVTQDQSWETNVTSVTVDVNYITIANTTQYSGLTIPSDTISAGDSSGTFTVTGAVDNTGNQVAGSVWVATTFYNSSGAVIGLNFTNYLSSALSPGDSVPFTATPTDNSVQLSSEITNYSFDIQSGAVTPSASPSPAPSGSSVQPSSSPTTSAQPTKSPVSINSEETFAALAAMVGVAVVVTAMLLIRKHYKIAKFEPPPPPPPPP